MKSTSKWHASIFNKHSFRLKFSFESTKCTNQLNLSNYTRLKHQKHNLSPKNFLLEIESCNLEVSYTGSTLVTKMCYLPKRAIACDYTLFVKFCTQNLKQYGRPKLFLVTLPQN